MARFLRACEQSGVFLVPKKYGKSEQGVCTGRTKRTTHLMSSFSISSTSSKRSLTEESARERDLELR